MKKRFLLLFFLCSFSAVWAQTEERVAFTSITPSENTGQDYSSWLSDDVNNLVPNAWGANMKTVEVTLTLAKRTKITRLSLYDFEGVFEDQPAQFFALRGTTKTWIGQFTGNTYMNWVDVVPGQPIEADAILIQKYGNNIPQKIKVFGQAVALAGKPVPGKLEAEQFTQKSWVNIEGTTDEGGGQQVTAINDDDWMEYDVNVASAGTYSVKFRVSNAWGDGRIELRTASGAVLCAVDVPRTGGWQTYTTVSATAALTAGPQTWRVYAKKGDWNFNWFSVSTPTTDTPPPPPPTETPLTAKIKLEPRRWYQLNNVSNGLEGLFDGNTNQNVHTGWGKLLANFDAVYPLDPGETMTLEGIKFYDGPGIINETPLTVYIINSQWQRIKIATFTGSQYNTWVGPNGTGLFRFPSPISGARYLVINSWGNYPTEVELYGQHQVTQTSGARRVAAPNPVPLKYMFGINAFEWDFQDGNNTTIISEPKMQALKSFTGVRHYVDWDKLEKTPGQYTFNPTHNGSWNYDLIYERAKAEGIEILACLKTIPPWMVDTYPADQRDWENVPARFGSDLMNPASYIEQAKVAFQFTARYGANPNVNRALLSVNAAQRWPHDPVNVVKVGLNLVKYIECENERDKWWKGRKAYQTAYEYAANLSAFYDGHKNTMGPGVGVKNADPNMKVVVGGIASAFVGTDYIRGLIDWCIQHRGYRPDGSVNLCWDVINYHLYNDNNNSSQSGQATRGVAPEVSPAGRLAGEFVQLSARASQNMPVWVSETGYDINQGSPLKAVPLGNRTAAETQADWVLRSSLMYARLGVSKVFFYQAYDDNSLNPTQFASSGLLNSNQTRRPAADFLLQTQKLFGDFTYRETLNQNPIVDRYEQNGKNMYVLVVPDEQGRTAQHTLDLGTAAQAKIYRPRTGASDMAEETVNTVGGKLTLTVTETPMFVRPWGANGAARQSASATSSEPTGPSLQSTISIYPNPTADVLTLDVASVRAGALEVNVVDASAGTVKKHLNVEKASSPVSTKIDVSTLPTGAYILEVKQGQERAYHKFLKGQ